MMNALRSVGYALTLCLVFWPWLVMLFDLAAWMTVGAAVTGVQWTSERVVIYFCWPILFMTLACVLLA